MNNNLNPEREQAILQHEAEALDIVYGFLAEDQRDRIRSTQGPDAVNALEMQAFRSMLNGKSP